MNQPDDTQAYIQQCIRGRPEAWDWLVTSYGPKLYAYFFRRVASASEAEDLLQELMMKLVSHLDSDRHQGRFDAWLFTLAANLVRDRARRRIRHPAPVQLPDEPLDTPAHAAQTDPAHLTEHAELHDRVQLALADLPDLDREILLLRYYGGLSFKELAEHFQLPIGTALAKVHRGLKTLRHKLGSVEI